MTDGAHISPLERLYELDALPRVVLPGELARLHDGDLGFDEECLYANFVVTLDGVVAIPSMPRSNEFVAGDSDADRFVMGLLRAFADAVVIGSGVLRASPRGTWRPEGIYPQAASDYAELRLLLGTTPAPEVTVLTGNGSIDPRHPLFESGALVITSDAEAARLRDVLPSATTVMALPSDPEIDPNDVVRVLRERDRRRILCEAGPHTFGSFLAAGVVDELFLTSSPLLVGDGGPGSRLRLVEGADLASAGIRPQLLSLRRHGSHLFHRYKLR